MTIIDLAYSIRTSALCFIVAVVIVTIGWLFYHILTTKPDPPEESAPANFLTPEEILGFWDHTRKQ